MSEERWIFVTPAPGRRSFDSHLSAALVSPSAPPHIWVTAEPRGFVVKLEDYKRWLESDGPIEVAYPRHVTIFLLDCARELNAVMKRLHAKMPKVARKLAERARR